MMTHVVSKRLLIFSSYGRVLARIMHPKNPSGAKYMVTRILERMACSYRVLKYYELLDGISLDDSNTIPGTRTRNGRDVLDLCRPLIEDGPSNTVEFVRFSARE